MGAVFQRIPAFDKFVQGLRQLVTKGLASRGIGTILLPQQDGTDGGQGRKTVTETDKVTRSGAIELHSGRKAFQIIHSAQGFPQGFPFGVLCMEKGNSILDTLDRPCLAPGVAEHFFQQTVRVK